jgi:hypothetical protein
MNPSDLRAHGLTDGAIVEITVPHASIHGVVRATDEIKPGVISMSHAFGDTDGGVHDVALRGASTNRLVNDEVGYDPITGQCRQSAIPVRVARVPRAKADDVIALLAEATLKGKRSKVRATASRERRQAAGNTWPSSRRTCCIVMPSSRS